MKSLPPGLGDHLASGVTTLCWCWKLSRNDGLSFGFTDHDERLRFGGDTYEAASGFAGSRIEASLGLSVDNLDVAGALHSAALNEDDLAAGLFDNAEVEISRVNWRNVSERLLMRTGNLGEVSRSAHAFSAEIRGLAHTLGQPAGRLFQYGCDADLGDLRCRVDLNAPAFVAAGTVGAAQDRRRFIANGLDAYRGGWFQRGKLCWQSGANAALCMEVKSHRQTPQGIAIELWHPMARDVAAGDAFTVTAGCDKQFSTCREKFANGLNFRGFPHMPGTDFVLNYPSREDGTHDGGALS